MAHVTVNHLVQTTFVCCLRVQHAASATSNQKSDRDQNALRVIPDYPVPLSSANHQWLQTDTIGQQTRRLRAYLFDLRRARKRKEFLLECRKSNIAPVWSLPAAEIITLTTDDDNGDDLDTYHSMPWVSSHACRLWRNVAMSTEAPWPRVYVDDTTRGRNHPFAVQLLQLYLARSKEIPYPSVSILRKKLMPSLTTSSPSLPTAYASVRSLPSRIERPIHVGDEPSEADCPPSVS